jgi:hypothetical protein
MTEETFKMMKEKGAWFSMKPILNEEDAMSFPPCSTQQEKFIRVTDGTVRGVDPHNIFVLIMKDGKVYKITI